MAYVNLDGNYVADDGRIYRRDAAGHPRGLVRSSVTGTSRKMNDIIKEGDGQKRSGLAISSEAAAAAARRRHALASQAVRDGVADAHERIPDMPPAINRARQSYDVIRRLAEEHAMQAFEAGERGSAASFALLMRHGWPEPAREPSPAGDAAVTVSLSDAAAAALADILRSLASGRRDGGDDD